MKPTEYGTVKLDKPTIEKLRRIATRNHRKLADELRRMIALAESQQADEQKPVNIITES